MKRGRMGLLVIVGLALALVVVRPTAALAQAAFPDVPTDNWTLYDTVQEMASKGILNGYPDGTFGGRRAMTRWEFARALWRVVVRVNQELAKLRPSHACAGPSVEALSRRTFADVTPEHASDWGLDELAALGIVNGYPDGTFAPRRSMTQGELAAALQRMLQWVDRELAEIQSAHGEMQPGSAPRK